MELVFTTLLAGSIGFQPEKRQAKSGIWRGLMVLRRQSCAAEQIHILDPLIKSTPMDCVL